MIRNALFADGHVKFWQVHGLDAILKSLFLRNRQSFMLCPVMTSSLEFLHYCDANH